MSTVATLEFGRRTVGAFQSAVCSVSLARRIEASGTHRPSTTAGKSSLFFEIDNETLLFGASALRALRHKGPLQSLSGPNKIRDSDPHFPQGYFVILIPRLSCAPRSRRESTGFVFLGSLACCLILCASQSLAQLIPQTSDFQLNTHTPSFQIEADVSTHDDGSFTTVWKTIGSTGPDTARSIQQRRYLAGGAPDGTETQVNTYGIDAQESPAIDANASGAYVVVWNSQSAPSGDTTGFSIRGQRFAADGTPDGAEFQANSSAPGDQTFPAVALAPDGTFMVVWGTSTYVGDTFAAIAGRIFDPAGVPLADDFLINSYTNSSQAQPDVSVDADGNFTVVWRSAGSSGNDSSSDSIQGQRYDITGAPLGGEFQVNTLTPGSQTQPAVSSAAAGDFVIVWHTVSPADPDGGVRARRFGADGVAKGADFAVNTTTTAFQGAATADHDSAGNAVITWTDYSAAGPDTDGGGIRARVLRADGFFQGDEFQVNSSTVGSQSVSQVSVGAAGDVVVVWQTSSDSPGDDTDHASIGRLFLMPEIPLCPPQPSVSCTSAASGKSLVLLKDNADNSKDLIKVKIGRADATALVDFGDPVGGSTLTAVCVYDASGNDQPLLVAQADPATTCDTTACWKAAGSKAFVFKDKDATQDGLTGVKLKSGDIGKASILVKGKGANLPMPLLGLTLPVTVQVMSDEPEADARCWQVEFTEAKKNQVDKLIAKGPAESSCDDVLRGAAGSLCKR